MSVEIVVGRALAFCVHPRAAWGILPPSGRALVIAAYACAGYVACLSALMLF
jgi:hypothetical protein